MRGAGGADADPAAAAAGAGAAVTGASALAGAGAVALACARACACACERAFDLVIGPVAFGMKLSAPAPAPAGAGAASACAATSAPAVALAGATGACGSLVATQGVPRSRAMALALLRTISSTGPRHSGMALRHRVSATSEACCFSSRGALGSIPRNCWVRVRACSNSGAQFSELNSSCSAWSRRTRAFWLTGPSQRSEARSQLVADLWNSCAASLQRRSASALRAMSCRSAPLRW